MKRKASTDLTTDSTTKNPRNEQPSDTAMEESTNEKVSWGEWMGSWKAGTSSADQEAERIDRQKAAFGQDTVARLKDLNVLIIGCRGVGVETAKNLILSNVGGVVVYDSNPCRAVDRGANFYVTDEHVASGVGRAEASLPELRSLNPYCRVDLCSADGITDEYLQTHDVLGSGLPFSAVVVTDLAMLTKADLFRINETCRTSNIAFILAVNHGVTASIFSDFGPHHEIFDLTGEPTQTLAVSNIEVMPSKSSLLRVSGVEDGKPVVIITVAQSEHGLDDGDVVSFDDMKGDLAVLNGRTCRVKRVAMDSPTDAKVDSKGVVFKELLKLNTPQFVATFQKQYDSYKKQFDEEKKDGDKFRVRTITIFNRLALVFDDDEHDLLGKTGLSAPNFAAYESGGLLNQVKPPVSKSYKSLSETLESTPVPQMLRGEDWEAGVGINVHLSFAAVLDFNEQEGRWPGIHDSKDASKLVDTAKAISESRKEKEGSCWSQSVSFGFPMGEPRDLDETRVGQFARLFLTELTGFCSYLGGAAAQEVLKKIGKFTPVEQWVHHDEMVLLSDCLEESGGTSYNHAPLFGSRYDHQIAIMGKDFQARAANSKIFLVGCGALGCEYLKGLALMGVGTGKDGSIVVTDMDTIEVSNLSRQFLFRQHDVGEPKSVQAAGVVKKWNPRVKVTALEKKVGPDTEDSFDDSFWESLTVCWNALDNVEARKYTDRRCLFYSKPLLESGTLGTKCNHEVILPYRTSTYNDGKESDDNENQIAMCTLRSFPYLPKHCIEFAKQAYFSDHFEFGPGQYETFRNDMMSFFEQLEAMEHGEQKKSLTLIKLFIDLQKENEGKIDFNACIRVAFTRMIEDFRTSILNICHSADQMEKADGTKFWTGTKRRPRAIDWSGELKPDLMEYLYCSSNLYAVVWGVEPVRDRFEFETVVKSLGLEQPEWTPSSANVDLSEGDGEAAAEEGSDDSEELKRDLYAVDVSKLIPAIPHDFEKDDDANFHIDYLTSATNLRSWNYDIKLSARHDVKVTAGRIIPALATTTAMVCGLVDVEFCKIVLGLQCLGRDKFLNSNINLAAGSGNFTTFTPDPPVTISSGLKLPQPESFTSWDKIEITPPGSEELTVEQLVAYLENTFGVTVDRIFAFGHDDSKIPPLYNAIDRQKIDWDITFDSDGKVQISDKAIFTQWAQLPMATQMFNRLPPTSGARKRFEDQIMTTKKALDQTKENFLSSFRGAISDAYCAAYRPGDSEEDAEARQYFDTVSEARDYVTLGVHCHTSTEEDITLPCIKYIYSKP
uniref:Ubiquitin-activating enzyme E1 C-terminal domain-containing protein n=1 Tax=Ditylum brightwellii TaxID=49249 RepID=A0A7S4R506_9STRA|mmetsp:Transcript_21146/g.31165  ORF Transcript_21146/g.31165 Transcript_21146/m.31165 type:complete len:1286 (+) Transcript_21146:131-3988(+)